MAVRVSQSTAPELAAMYLVPVAGPEFAPLTLRASAGGLTIGRHGDCDLLLPADADRVSRFHARFDTREGSWTITDLGSRWGTTVNGVRLAANVAVPLAEGDLVRIAPFTFVYSTTPERRGMQARGDDMASRGGSQTIVRTIGGGAEPTGLADGLLQLVLTCAEQLHKSTDERTLANRLMDAALRGSGLTNAAFLRAVDLAGRFELVAAKFAGDEPPEFSQSLIAAASTGQPAELSIQHTGLGSQSIAQMNIASALCVPLLIGQGDVDGDGIPDATVAAYLYLDSRGMLAPQLRPQAREFCIALGRIASLALANIKRIEIERRSAKLDAELKGAANVQAFMLPKRDTRVGPLACIGESRAGQTIGGDFFDLIDLGGGQIAVTIGDVSGKGVIASVLMTATHGYLHAALRASKDPKTAVEATHAFVGPRRPANKFVTAWVGVIDLNVGTLTYVDAGHGYAILREPGGKCTVLEDGGGPPIGMIEEATYEAVEVAWPAGAALLLMSDGIVEQFGQIRRDDGTTAREQFQVSGVINCLQTVKAGADPVSCIFEAVYKHGGSPTLSDDATLLWIQS